MANGFKKDFSKVRVPRVIAQGANLFSVSSGESGAFAFELPNITENQALNNVVVLACPVYNAAEPYISGITIETYVKRGDTCYGYVVLHNGSGSDVDPMKVNFCALYTGDE